ncbi:hypothetical protein C8R46DRAFT_1283169 [Mycena filopes]|nr:hypothetical protein C8R46DRAFT_1283169 [Mycena filopes]
MQPFRAGLRAHDPPVYRLRMTRNADSPHPPPLIEVGEHYRPPAPKRVRSSLLAHTHHSFFTRVCTREARAADSHSPIVYRRAHPTHTQRVCHFFTPLLSLRRALEASCYTARDGPRSRSTNDKLDASSSLGRSLRLPPARRRLPASAGARRLALASAFLERVLHVILQTHHCRRRQEMLMRCLPPTCLPPRERRVPASTSLPTPRIGVCVPGAYAPRPVLHTLTVVVVTDYLPTYLHDARIFPWHAHVASPLCSRGGCLHACHR